MSMMGEKILLIKEVVWKMGVVNSDIIMSLKPKGLNVYQYTNNFLR